jgi:membrane protein implicated in regulation of membrane protease activity
MTWLTDNFATLLVVLGVVLLVLEVGVFGFSLFILFFIGLACILAGILMAIGILPQTMVIAFGSVALLTLVLAFALWKPLKRMQDSGGNKDIKGDFIGDSFTLASPVSTTQTSLHRMSGVDWKVKSEVPITAGTVVEIVKIEVGELTVAAKQ